MAPGAVTVDTLAIKASIVLAILFNETDPPAANVPAPAPPTVIDSIDEDEAALKVTLPEEVTVEALMKASTGSVMLLVASAAPIAPLPAPATPPARASIVGVSFDDTTTLPAATTGLVKISASTVLLSLFKETEPPNA